MAITASIWQWFPEQAQQSSISCRASGRRVVAVFPRKARPAEKAVNSSRAAVTETEELFELRQENGFALHSLVCDCYGWNTEAWDLFLVDDF